MKCFTPRDLMEHVLVHRVADFTWECIRLMRWKTLSMEYNFRERIDFQGSA